jgi:hypothetical protein
MDDRILLVPPDWTPDPAVYGRWPMVRACLERLQSFLPVDHFRWPSLPGEPCEGDPQDCVLDAFAEQLRPEHHVVCFLASEVVLLALSRHRARSLVTATFIPSPATAAAQDDMLAAALTAQNVISRKLSQIVPMIMQGADVADVNRVIADLRRTTNYDFVAALRDDVVSKPRAPEPLRGLPTLYLSPALGINPGEEPIFAIFRSFVPEARHDFLTEWALHLHEEAGGHELADKVIPFIQKVIVGRGAG